MKIIFEDRTFSLQLFRTIVRHTTMVHTLANMCPQHFAFETWILRVGMQNGWVHKYAEDCLSASHKVSAREAYMRACFKLL
jgi:hypothetical protein